MTDHSTPRDILATRIAQLQARIERIHARQVELGMQVNQLAAEVARDRRDTNRRLDALEARDERG